MRKRSVTLPQARSVTAAQQEQLIEAFSKIAAAKGMQIHLCCEDRALTRANVDADGCLSQTVLERAIGSCFACPEEENGERCLLPACWELILGCIIHVDMVVCIVMPIMINESVRVNRKLHDPASPLLIGHLHETDIIKEAEQKLWQDGQLSFSKWDFKKLIQKGMVMIMTKQEKN